MWRSEARRDTTSISRSAKSMSIALPIDAPAGAVAAVRAALDKGSRAQPAFPGPPRTSAAADDAGDLGDRGAALFDLLEAVVGQAPHPLPNGHVSDLLRGTALERHRLDLLGDGHDLVDPDAPAVAAAAAAPAARGLIGLEVEDRLVAAVLQHACRDDCATLAVRAQHPHETLCHHAVHRGGDEE